MEFVDLVAESARRTPDKVAVVDANRQLTFSQVDDRAECFAWFFDEVVSRDSARARHVALLALNEAEFLEMQTGAVRAGLTLVPLNHRLSDDELTFILRDCEPAAIIAGRTFEARVRRLQARTGVSAGWGLGDPTELSSYEGALASAPVPGAEARGDHTFDGDAGASCLLMYTSGTTGRPKGALFSRRAFTARLLVNVIELEATRESVFLQSLPMFHVSGLLGYGHVYAGATMVLLEAFDADEHLDLIQKWGVTSTALVPTTLSMIVDAQTRRPRDVSSLDLLIYGGSSIHPDLLARAMSTFPTRFHQQFGMTETMGGLSILRPADHDPEQPDKLRSAGTETITYRAEVVDEDDQRVPDGEIGEIVCSGPALMHEYLNLPEVTARTLRGGWLHTGDLGYRDGDGFLHVVDRRNNMIITGGENVYPREVEDVLLTHPGVTDVVVIGLSDPTWGERIVGVVLDDAPPEAELDRHVRDRLANYKVPKEWIRLPSIPRNATGKVQRGDVKALIHMGQSELRAP